MANLSYQQPKVSCPETIGVFSSSYRRHWMTSRLVKLKVGKTVSNCCTQFHDTEEYMACASPECIAICSNPNVKFCLMIIKLCRGFRL